MKHRTLASCAMALAMLALPAIPQSVMAEVFIPRFMDPKVRVERPDTSALRVVRFLTDDEFPPFHFADPDGGLAGFSVDLARAICDRMKLACTIQARRFDTLVEALGEGRGDVLAAAMPLTPAIRRRFAASQVYHRTPARFVSSQSGVDGSRQFAEPSIALSPATLEGRKVAVVEGSAHAAFLGTFFPRIDKVAVADVGAALAALKQGQVEFAFGDAGALALWLGGRGGAGFRFVGGPYLDSRYFGEGIAFMVRSDDQLLRRTLDYGLQQLWDDGTYAKLYLRYFPVGLY